MPVRKGEIHEGHAIRRKERKPHIVIRGEADRLRINVIVHGTTFSFCFVPREDADDGHTTGVLVIVGGEGKSALVLTAGLYSTTCPVLLRRG